MNFSREVANFRRLLTAAGSPEQAAKAKAYLHSELQFLGADAKAIRAAARDFAAANPDVGRAQLCGFVRALWQTNVHDLRSIGVALLELRRDCLEPPDLKFLEELLRSAKTWALVDWLAVHVAGDLVQRNKRLHADLRRWAKDQDAWLRRAALLALLLPLRQGRMDLTLFTELAVPMFGDSEPMLTKAIGWVLREACKKQPELVRAFVATHGEAMAPPSRREALRGLAQPARSRR